MATITKESDPNLWEKLVAAYREEGDRGWVVGPRGGTYKVLRPDDDTIIFDEHGGLDGTYGQRSTKGISGS